MILRLPDHPGLPPGLRAGVADTLTRYTDTLNREQSQHMGRTEKSRLQYMAEKLKHVEHERSRPITQDDVGRLLEDLASDDVTVLASALREVCPCRMTWEVFEQVRKPALKHRKHPTAEIGALADHIEEDAQEVAALEAIREREIERRDSWEEDQRSRKRR